MTNLYEIKSTGLYRVKVNGGIHYVGASSMRDAVDTWERLEENRKRNSNMTYVSGKLISIKRLGDVIIGNCNDH